MGMFAAEPLQLFLEMFHERFVPEGPFAVRPPLGVHLQQSQVHPELDFFQSIFAAEFADDNLPWLIIPLIQQGGNIKTHNQNMDALRSQVNASAKFIL